MTANEIAQRLSEDVRGVVLHLLPNAKEIGKDWCVGSVNGQEGKSLKVCSSGNKAGIWCDFSEGGSGDLLDLWRESFGISTKEAMKDACVWLGIDLKKNEFSKNTLIPKPIEEPESTELKSSIAEYCLSRGISQETLDMHAVTEMDGMIIFPSYQDGDLMMWMAKDPENKKSPYTSKNSTPILFGWQAVSDDAREVVITEGQFDTMSYSEAGMGALSLPYGAGVGGKLKWIEYQFDQLAHFDTIYISFDMDDKGQATIEEVVKRLGRHRCRVVELPMKDANECLVAGLNLQDFVNEAKSMDPVELVAARHYHDEIIDLFYPDEDSPLIGMPMPWESTHKKLRFRNGETTQWVGYGGHGKSMLLSHIMSYACGLGHRFNIFSGEMKPSRYLKRMYQQSSAVDTPSVKYIDAITDYFDDKLWVFDVWGNAKTKKILEVFKYACQRYNIDQFVIDSLAKCGINEDDYNTQKIFWDQCGDFAHEYDVHVHMITHCRKGTDEYSIPGKMDVKGTGALTDMADNGITVWRNKRKEEAIYKSKMKNEDPPDGVMDKPDCVLSCWKQRHHDWEEKIGLWFFKECHQYVDNKIKNPKQIVQFKASDTFLKKDVDEEVYTV